MPINFNLRSFSEYLFSPSAKTDGTSGTSTARAGKSRAAFSFSALRNSGWAQKCAAFDPAKLARTISNNPRTRKAVETAKSGLNSLYKQMTVLMKNLRGEPNVGGPYGGYRPAEEQRINGQWHAFLPPGATILPGSTIDPHSRKETISWHKDGVVWISTHNPSTGERVSSTGWGRMGDDGWQRGQTIDHRTGAHWYTTRHLASGQHTGRTAWTAAEAEGWQRCKMFDFKTNTHWNAFHHAGTDKSFLRTEWSKPGEDGVKSRKHLDQNTKTLWHETLNIHTGEHVSKTDWHDHPSGERRRVVKDHQTGKTHVERDAHAKPSENFEQGHFAFNLNGRTAAALAAESLAILGLDKNETDMGKIRKQYRALSMKHHPDKVANQQDGAAVEEAKVAFQKIAHAYEFLTSEHFPVQQRKG